MRDDDFLEQYVNAARESSNRTRQILAVMIIASILVFAAYWNSRQDAWVNNRIHLQHVVYLLQIMPDLHNPYADTRVRQDLTDELGTEISDEYYEEVKDIALNRSLDQTKSALQWLTKIRSEQSSQVQVPGLGVSFDVNDIGMLGGFAFAVLLIWVNYSLWHQSTNLKLAFEFAESLQSNEGSSDRILYFTYQNLAMRQVLTIPPKPASIRDIERDGFKFWVQNVSKLLYALPLAVQATVVIHDWRTRKIGMLVNPHGTRVVLSMGTTLLCLILLLTYTCYHIWSKTYKTWESVAAKA